MHNRSTTDATNPPMDAAIIDLDGTVYRSETVIPGAPEGIALLRDAGIDTVFVTNSETKSREACRDRLASLGIEADVSQFVTSASVTAAYVTDHYPGNAVLVIGEQALHDEFTQAGAAVTTEPADADVVVVGNDSNFDYETLARGLRAVDAGAALIGTNGDRKVPTDDGMYPGAGALIEAIAYAATHDPDRICGKPNQPMIDVSLETLGTDPADCLIIGDNPETDIEMGRRAGLTTVLVLSGVVDNTDLLLGGKPADYVIDSLGEIGTVLDSS